MTTSAENAAAEAPLAEDILWKVHKGFFFNHLQVRRSIPLFPVALPPSALIH